VSARAATWRPRNLPGPEAYVAGVAAALAAHRVWPWHLPGPKGWRHVVAWPLAIAGTRLIAGAVRAAGTVDLEHPNGLVTGGPYAHSRNPMYVGCAMVGLAAGVMTRSGWMLAAVPVAAAWTHMDVLEEERRLATSFGAEFAAYRAAVPRYVGRSRRRWRAPT
jgi:protein-S-isoprenylcysteine O-methyltransferase Ste14